MNLFHIHRRALLRALLLPLALCAGMA
ncbi:MAG: hypothetical protein RLZ58_1765, partial [Pseudomonadota bacterium]